MKKTFTLLFAFMVFAASVYADEDITVIVNGGKIEFDQPPILYNDRTLVPTRAIFESLGLTVQWFGDEQRVTAFNDETNITMFIDKKTVYVDGIGFETDVAPMIVGERTLVPLRVIGEALNGNVEWDSETKTVTIYIAHFDKLGNGDRTLEYRAFAYTNAERKKHGLDALTWNEQLAAVARAHSLDMAERGFFNHYDPDGISPFDRIKAAGIKYTVAAENIAAGQPSPQKAVEGWMNSEGHRENILNPDLKEIGIGIARGGEYGIYWTQTFAKLK